MKKQNENTKKSQRCKEARPFTGLVWVDDYTDIWVGNCNKLQKKISEVSFAGEEVTPFEGSAKCCDYIYFVTWSNNVGENAMILELTGTNKILSGDRSKWEVFATDIGFASSAPRPKKEFVECQIKKANCKGWDNVFVGNTNGREKGLRRISPMDNKARYIWYNSGADTRTGISPRVPFNVFNHKEFLIFRVPAKDLFIEMCQDCSCSKCKCSCGDGCDGCNKNASDQELNLRYLADDKHFTIPAKQNYNCQRTVPNGDCDRRVSNSRLTNISPCFYFQWGDGNSDQIEEHDTEVFYITISNPFSDIRYKGLRITKVSLVPQIPVDDGRIDIVPETFISLDCLEPCSSKSREFALITRENNIAGAYQVKIEYCFESIEFVLNKELHKFGIAEFDIKITED